MRAVLLAAGLVFVTGVSSAPAELPSFEAVTIDPQAGEVCYAVTLADVDGDTKQDIVVVTERAVLWYQNPSWTKKVIIEDQTPRDNVCIAAADIDQDGKVDFALGAGWTKTGTIHWLQRGGSLDEKWKVHSIGEEVWLHRMRFADVLGKGRPQLVISPLNASEGRPGVRVTAFEIPKDPAKDRWQPTVLSSDLNRMHNHWHTDFDNYGMVDTLISCREGVFLVRRKGEDWLQEKIGEGVQGDSPDASGAGEIKTGRFKNGSRFVTTVEPMHGTSLAVYTGPKKAGAMWERHVLDSSLKRGHALWTADLDRDGTDEIVLGHSDTGTGEWKGPGLFIFDTQDETGSKWKKHVLDNGGVATEDVIVGDLNGDGWPDVVGCGRATHNVKLYWNRGGAK